MTGIPAQWVRDVRDTLDNDDHDAPMKVEIIREMMPDTDVGVPRA